MKGRVVLLVQPNRDERDMYADYLSAAGFGAIAVPDGRAALAAAAGADAIVTGILLEGDMDGISLVRQLRADERTRRIPIIVLTACAYEADRSRAEQAGCDLFLPKPCLPEVLLRGLGVLWGARLRRPSATKAQLPHLRSRNTRPRRSGR